MDDLPQCLEIYALNEPGRFPEGFIAKYEASLKDSASYTLVAECDGRLVATGRLAYVQKEYIAIMSYGLVRPGFHGRGIGTALVLARLSLLDSKRAVHRVFIFAIEKSIGFYRRFGFLPFQSWKDERGLEHPSGYLIITKEEVCECRRLLAREGISVPDDEGKIPFSEKLAE
jgi:N-acetylglutamate synthase-like GNAT family acetyltransferase